MFRTLAGALAASALLLSFGAPAHSATTLFAILTNFEEPTPVIPTFSNGALRPVSFGDGTFILNDAGTALTYSINVFNIDFTGLQTADVNDNLIAAHIHAGPSIAPTQPVRFGFFGAPFNDNNPNDVVFTPFANGVGGSISGKWDASEGNNTTLAAELGNILAGRAYVNFHTVQFAGGEIRGVITSVPEPSTWAMMLLGFGVIGAAIRCARRKQKPTVSYA
jgi:hypothetical protein